MLVQPLQVAQSMTAHDLLTPIPIIKGPQIHFYFLVPVLYTPIVQTVFIFFKNRRALLANG